MTPSCFGFHDMQLTFKINVIIYNIYNNLFYMN